MIILRYAFRKQTETILVRLQRYASQKLAVTGIQPSGILHLGNYLGAVKPCVKYCKTDLISKLYVIIADLHALTSTKSDNLNQRILELASTLIACGLGGNNLKAPIFPQSAVHGHTELSWILTTCCSIPRLAHLPQWREKSGYSSGFGTDETCTATVGLFTYPVLQASDILLYGADIVPVGSDQATHIELTRDLVRAATFRWPKLRSLLKIPEDVVLEDSKVMSLRDPIKKMSKSDPSEMGVIYLADCQDKIRQKIRRAQTDSVRAISYDPLERPGVSNLLRILSLIKGMPVDQILIEASKWDKEELKSKVIDAIIEELDPIRNQMNMLMNTPQGLNLVHKSLQSGSIEASRLAKNRLNLIYQAVGCDITDTDSTRFIEQSIGHESG